MRRLHAFAASDPPPISPDDWQLIDFRVCESLLRVLIEGTPAARERRPSLDRLDSLMQDGPRGFAGAANFAPTAFANYTIARLREAQGDLSRAFVDDENHDVHLGSAKRA